MSLQTRLPSPTELGHPVGPRLISEETTSTRHRTQSAELERLARLAAGKPERKLSHSCTTPSSDPLGDDDDPDGDCWLVECARSGTVVTYTQLRLPITSSNMANYDNPMRSTYVPGMDDFYAPALSPEVISPEPQRYATGIVVVGLKCARRGTPECAVAGMSCR